MRYNYRLRALIAALVLLTLILLLSIAQVQAGTRLDVVVVSGVLALLGVGFGIWVGLRILSKTEKRNPVNGWKRKGDS